MFSPKNPHESQQKLKSQNLASLISDFEESVNVVLTKKIVVVSYLNKSSEEILLFGDDLAREKIQKDLHAIKSGYTDNMHAYILTLENTIKGMEIHLNINFNDEREFMFHCELVGIENARNIKESLHENIQSLNKHVTKLKTKLTTYLDKSAEDVELNAKSSSLIKTVKNNKLALFKMILGHCNEDELANALKVVKSMDNVELYIRSIESCLSDFKKTIIAKGRVNFP